MEAYNGSEALNCLERNKDKSPFEFIFMDLNMPVMDGIECIRRAKQREIKGQCNLKDTMIIAVSAISERIFREKEGSQLFDSFFEKPLMEKTLREIFED